MPSETPRGDACSSQSSTRLGPSPLMHAMTSRRCSLISSNGWEMLLQPAAHIQQHAKIPRGTAHSITNGVEMLPQSSPVMQPLPQTETPRCGPCDKQTLSEIVPKPPASAQPNSMTPCRQVTAQDAPSLRLRAVSLYIYLHKLWPGIMQMCAQVHRSPR